MRQIDYFMDSEYEAIRLDKKTKPSDVEIQAGWAGIKPGMRVLDFGCGAGKTTYALAKMVSPTGSVVGIDGSEKRIAHARASYDEPSIQYHRRDFREPMTDLGTFDFIWTRFVLEYFKKESYAIVGSIYKNLNPGGTMCLIDLDYNCLNHFGLPKELDDTVKGVISHMERHHNFDPYIGRKLYAFLYDLGCEEIEVELKAHHLIYGQLDEIDHFNWLCKMTAAKSYFKSEKAYQDFEEAFFQFFSSPRRFTYTPLIMCKGKKPVS